MARKIQFKRGLKKNLPTLSPGEMAYTTDEKSAYIGDGAENIRLLDQKDKGELTAQLAEMAVNVKLFGAKGDGITDDTATIQNALDYVKAKGGTVLFPIGVYKTSYTLLYHSNLHIMGYGAKIFFSSKTPVSAASVLLNSGYDNNDITENVIIEGLTLEMDSDIEAQSNCIGAAYVKNIKIINVKAYNFRWHMTDLATCENVMINGCHAENLKSGAYQIDGTNNTSVYGITPDGKEYSNLVSTDKIGCKNVSVLNNTAVNCETGVHLHRDGSKDILIQGNKLYNCSYSAFLSDDGEFYYNVTFTNNHIENCMQGFHWRGNGDNILVSDNTFNGERGKSDMGIRFGFILTPGQNPVNVICVRNTIKNHARAMWVQKSSGGLFSNNQVTDCGYHTTAIVKTNSKSDLGRHSLYIEESSNITVSSNQFLNNHFCDIILNPKTTQCDNINIEGNVFQSKGNALNGSVVGTGTLSRISFQRNKIKTGEYSFFAVNFFKLIDSTINNNEIKAYQNAGIEISGLSDKVTIKDNLVEQLNATVGSMGIRFYESNGEVKDNKLVNFENAYSFEGGGTQSTVNGVLDNTPARSGTVNGVIEYTATTFPAHASFSVGSKVINNNPTAGGYTGWIKTSAGWKGYGLISS